MSDDSVALDESQAATLHRMNIAAAALHTASGGLMIALGNDFSLPVTVFSLGGPPGSPLEQGQLETVAELPLAPLTAAFMFLSALFHLLVAFPARRHYEAELRRGQNRFRWVEYSMSATLMIVLIALIVSISDIGALIGLAAANIAMILFGWVMEVVNDVSDRSTARWFGPFWFGCIAGAAPWLAIAAYILVPQTGADPPGFVYGIIVSLFVLFNCFAVVQWLQYRQLGRFADYLTGERAYIVLSFVAKSLLAWQVYANVLVG